MAVPLTDDVTLVVIAGGRGRRMGGVVKPLLKHPAGGTLIERLLAELEPGVQATLIVVPTTVAPMFEPLGRQRAFDPGRGPPQALAAAAAAVETPWLVATAADLVQPRRALLDRLLERRSQQVDVVVPVADGYPQPLFAVYRTAALVPPPPPTLMTWLDQLRTLRIPMDPDAEALADADTVEDAERFGLTSS